MSTEPETEEQYLRAALANLQESYAKAAKPYIDRLCDIYAYRQSVLRVGIDRGGQPLFRIVEPDEMYEPSPQA